MAKKAKQARLPGTEDAKIEALHWAAEEWSELKEQRKEIKESEDAVKDRLLAEMQKAGKVRYAYNGIVIEVEGKQTVKVKLAKKKQAG